MTDARDSLRENSDEITDLPAGSGSGLLSRHRWLPFVLPMLVYMFSGHLAALLAPEDRPVHQQPAANGERSDTPGEDGFAASQTDRWYPLAYAARLVLTLAAMVIALPTYRMFKFRVSPSSIGVGVVGVILWVGLCNLNLEAAFWPALESALPGDWGIDTFGQREAYNPLLHLDGNLPALVGFLVIRLIGLALVIPIIEEFFLRGFLMRFVMDGAWWKLPVGAASAAAWAALIVYAVATHPGELLAAIAWFSLVTWLITRTKNIWDAVAAHVVTNLLLGFWILTTGQWRLW